MIKFERDNEIIYFKDAEAVLEWLIKNHDEGNKYDLLDEYSYWFAAWVEQNYTVMDILLAPEWYTYNNLYETWEEDILYDINSGWFDELQPVEDNNDD